jgi:hypothetical protein
MTPGGPARRGLEIRVLPGALAVARLEPGAALPAWARGDGAEVLHAVVRTPHETSVVCADASVPPDVRAERGWRALEVAGPLDHELTGVLASIAVPLAGAGVAIFAIATYDTDYVLVRDERLADAVRALRDAGHRVSDHA